MANDKNMTIHLKVWRQKPGQENGTLVDYTVNNVSTHMSFLEMMDVLNEDLIHKGQDPVAFDHDCREGICGACSMVINGEAHGPEKGTTTCQLHMRKFSNGDTIVVEPFRARAFPVVKDLIVDRSSLDRVIAAGGYISAKTGSAPDGNAMPISRDTAEEAMDAAACIGCGACAAACDNGAAMLFTAAKVSQLAILPQGEPERERRVLRMVAQMDAEQFGSCTNMGTCSQACPKGISLEHIARMNREYMRALLTSKERKALGGDG